MGWSADSYWFDVGEQAHEQATAEVEEKYQVVGYQEVTGTVFPTGFVKWEQPIKTNLRLR